VTSRRGKSRRRVAKTSQTPSRIQPTLSSSRFLFFGGKGGVGKTTAATATAFYYLEKAKPPETILLFSTDPAHSLSDSIGKPIGDQPTQIATVSGSKLIAYEMDANTALERFRVKHGKTLAEIAERGTFLDEADIADLLNLSLPGLDEVMSLFELSELHRTANYDRVIVDTAPSGHTTRLLRLPEVFTRMVHALDRMSDKHRYIVAHFARRRGPADEVDQFLTDLNERLERVRDLLQNKSHTSFSLVTIPEALSVRETERYLQLLRKEQIPVTDLIINRVETEHGSCPYCRARVEMQQPWLKELAKTFKGLRLHYVPLLPEEVRGVSALKKFGELVWTDSPVSRQGHTRPRSTVTLKSVTGVSREAAFPLESRKVVIFGGKGGVGKTTAAAAFALALARSDRRRRLLVFSTDPAHSLSDSFDEQIGELKKKVAGVSNLDAMEIDPGRWFEELKQRYRSWTDDLFASLSGGSKLEIKFDREAMRELVELTPPGIDEIAALGTISDLLDQQDYDTIVLDTAPTGHLIRFLELPQIALSWVRTFIKLLLKYQQVVHASRIAEELVSLSKSIKRVLALLADPEACEFVGIAIPERMSLEETVDLSSSLEGLQIPLQRLLINGLVPEEVIRACDFCRGRRRQQVAVVNDFQRRLETSLFVAPQQPTAVRGAQDLLNHFASWKSLSDTPPRLRSGRSKVKNIKRAG
jgi:arsenite/tail-anchored protein-transporting ATPase